MNPPTYAAATGTEWSYRFPPQKFSICTAIDFLTDSGTPLKIFNAAKATWEGLVHDLGIYLAVPHDNSTTDTEQSAVHQIETKWALVEAEYKRMEGSYQDLTTSERRKDLQPHRRRATLYMM
jgi:hypothetical protein